MEVGDLRICLNLFIAGESVNRHFQPRRTNVVFYLQLQVMPYWFQTRSIEVSLRLMIAYGGLMICVSNLMIHPTPIPSSRVSSIPYPSCPLPFIPKSVMFGVLIDKTKEYAA